MLVRTFTHQNGTLLSTTAAHVVHSGPVAPSPQPSGWHGVMRQPAPTELPEIYALEAASYPADEAATEEKLQFRLAKAPLYFRAMYATSDDSRLGALLGFICGTLASGEELRDETMSDHDPLGSTLCIHSVVTAAAMRRRGVAQTMLREYIAHLKSEAPTVTLVKLIAKEAVTPLYSKAGFSLLGPWDGEHGSEPWLEMEMKLTEP